MKITYLLTTSIAAALLAGCVEDTGVSSGVEIPLADVDACEAAVMRETGNTQVRTQDTNSSEANNTVIVGVGPNAAPWRCLVNRGVVADVMSMTDEGAL